MSTLIRRACLDFVAFNYRSKRPETKIVSVTPTVPSQQTTAGYEQHNDGKEKEKGPSAFTMRCYLSLQGEGNPAAPLAMHGLDEASALSAGQIIYRYDWAFGITLIEKFYWDWMNEFPDDGALAIHMVLEPTPIESAPEAVPVAAFLSGLHPSRSTKSFFEQVLPTILKGSAEMAKVGANALPALNYLSSGLALGSNVLESSKGDRKNWFLYQFVDEKLQCPVIEWRIYKEVLKEYGPLLRGTLFLAFPAPAEPGTGKIRIELRPQIHYCDGDELCYIIPTNELKPENRVFIEVCPGAI